MTHKIDPFFPTERVQIPQHPNNLFEQVSAKEEKKTHKINFTDDYDNSEMMMIPSISNPSSLLISKSNHVISNSHLKILPVLDVKLVPWFNLD